MHFISKKTSLIILGITALVCSRAMFWFFNDPEGPNLLIVVVAALIVYFLSLTAYLFARSATSLKKLLLAILIQIVIVTGAYFFLNGSDEQETSKLDVTDTVLNFYGEWLAAVKDPKSAEPSLKELAKSPILSKTLRDRLTKAQKNPAAGPDPVLCQTVPTENISTRRVYQNTDEAQVLVASRDKNVTEQALFTLVRINDGWYIDDIGCSLGEFMPDREFSFEREGFLLKASIPSPYSKENWHLVFEEDDEQGHVAPLLFDATSECTSLDGTKVVCKPDQFIEATKASVQGQMSERGVSVKFLKLIK